MTGKIRRYIKEIFDRDRFVEDHKSASGLRGRISIQLLAAFAFLVLSAANIISRSYIMLIFTAAGGVSNIVFACLAARFHSSRICAVSSILSCSLLFGVFVVYGGNEGFSCLWVVLLPLLAMVAMSFRIGLFASLFFQVFLIVVFWTPVRELLNYRYSEQFCLRFPLFFFVTFLLGLMLTISMRTSEYNEYRQILELEELNAKAQEMARTDPLTGLANRRFAYEEFDKKFVSANQPHCIVMGDIDCFKDVNDTYGHEFGDEVLVIFAEYAESILPRDYLKSRWGGEEFLFAANEPTDAVFANIENLRKAVENRIFVCNETSVHITITFGIASYTDADGLGRAITLADKRLCSGKKSGRNRTVTLD